MKLIIKSNTTIKNKTNINNFVYNYMPLYILDAYLELVDKRRFKKIDEAFKINSNKIIIYALNNLTVSRVNTSVYIISVNKNLRVYNNPIMPYLNLITYGNRSYRGYPILVDLFKEISENIDLIYEEWEHGYKVLRHGFNRKSKRLGQRPKFTDTVTK